VIFGTQRIPAAANWFDGSGNLIASGATLTDVPAGTYQLYLTDANGCTNLFKSYTLNQVEPLKINMTNAVVKSDVCGMGIGSITGILAYDGLGRYRYQWFDVDRKLLSETAELKNASAGTYYLEVYDESSCSGAKATFVLQNQQSTVAAPGVNDVSVCAAGKASIHVNNPVPGLYKLYKAEPDEYPLIENNTGSFVVDVSSSVNYFISRAEGSCESTRIKVSVTVADAELQIPNTFTPNGDGFNDTWEILNVVNYPECKVTLFNRYGGLVFQSNGYSTPFDGKKNGENLPSGVYYYIIELRKGCNLITGSLSLFR
jgi:gliding motility-associated-like protein